MKGRRNLDLRRDPPPDLAVEVDLWRSPIPRLTLYARLGAPEVWRRKKTGLVFYRLAGKKYAESPSSVSFPGLTPSVLDKLVAKIDDADDFLPILREFRVAVRKVRVKS